MRARHRITTWTNEIVKHAQVHVAAPATPEFIDIHQKAGEVHAILEVTDNAVEWSYRLRASVEPGDRPGWWRQVYIPVPYGMTDVALHKNAKTVPETHLAVIKWAVADLAKRGAAAGIGQVYTRPAGKAVQRSMTLDGIVYPDWPKVAGGRDLAHFHQIMLKAVKDCANAWNGWLPTKLQVEAFSGKRAMGLCYRPGAGKYGGPSRIAFNTKLLKEYADKAFWRVAVHELAHHARAEIGRQVDPSKEWAAAFNRMMTEKVGDRKAQANLRDHDPVFLYMLALVDPEVRPEGKSGVWFEEFRDDSLAMEERMKEEARAAKKASRESFIDWSPDAGEIFVYRLKSGDYRYEWRPLQKGAFPSKSLTATALAHAVREHILPPGEITQAEAGSRLSAYRVCYDPMGRWSFGQPQDLLGLLKLMRRIYVYTPGQDLFTLTEFVKDIP